MERILSLKVFLQIKGEVLLYHEKIDEENPL